MASLGEHIARAYIEVHADTGPFKADMARLKASTAKLGDTIGSEASKKFTAAWTKEIRGISMKSVFDKASGQVKKFARTVATDIKIIGAVLQDRVVRPINRGMVRAQNQIIVSIGKAKDAVVEFSSEVGRNMWGALKDQVLLVRHAFDELPGSLRAVREGFRDTIAAGMDMLAPGVWEMWSGSVRGAVSRARDELQLFSVHMRASAGRAVEAFRDRFQTLWNSSIVSGLRDVGASLASAIASGFTLAWNRVSPRIEATVRGTFSFIRDLTPQIGSLWSRTSKETKQGVDATSREVGRLKDELGGVLDGFEAIGDASEKMSNKVTSSSRKATRETTRFIGKLKGSRNDAVNAVGSIGQVLENIVSGTIVKGFQLVGGWIGKIGDGLTGLSGKAGFLEGPLAALGGALSKAGAGMTAVSSTGVGLVVVIAVLIVSFVAFGAAAAVLTSLLSSLAAIGVAFLASAFYALSGVLLGLVPVALALAGGIGVLVVAFKDLSDEAKKAFDPLKETFKGIAATVRERLFANLAEQMDKVKTVLNDFVGPLLVASADAMREVFDHLLAGLESPGVKSTLDTLKDTLPTILLNTGKAIGDFLLGILNFFGPISAAMVPISEEIGKIAAKFLEWTSQPENREKIAQFFEDAVESTRAWGPLITAVTDFLLNLFREGKSTGDDFVGSLTRIIEKFDWLFNTQEGREALSQWFRDGKQLASDLKGMIEQLAAIIDTLDSPENRASVQYIIDGLTDVFKAVDKVAAIFADLPELIRGISSVVFRITGLDAAVSTATFLWGLLQKIKGAAEDVRQPGWGMAGGGGGGRQLAQRTGGILTSPTQVLAGEAGAEMFVPLAIPLSQVDPSVRAVSAFARGMNPDRTGGQNPGKVVNIAQGAISVSAATDNVEQTANAVLDRLVARWK